MNSSISPQKITSLTNNYKFTIATLVTDMTEYREMVESFNKAGFTKDICEYIYIDNIGNNSFDAYEGLNLFLQTARGKYIIICHQDILLNFDNIDILKQRIEHISTTDPNWAILSNAGGIENNLYRRIAIDVVYEDGFEQVYGKKPQRVCTVDENFILVKRSANLSLSHDLTGFHLYGTDLCLVAELLGYSSYVIEFKLLHKSYGNPGKTYYNILNKLIEKYVRFMRSRTIITTITDFRLSRSSINTAFFNTKFVKKVYRKINKLE
ncbi:MAG TPA: hypothetical protein VNW95_17360 [Mucilaginibacter sp.]|jgi:hypothetical protein|nr:hypothetical protein [Mucilaginibacter sp.]